MNDLKVIHDKIVDKAPIVSDSYNNINKLKENGNLKKDLWYQITDYKCSISSSIAESANHCFDILVRANSGSSFDHNAFAIKHKGDTYFKNCDLSKWELKYDFDAIQDKYDWAPTKMAVEGLIIDLTSLGLNTTTIYKKDLQSIPKSIVIDGTDMSINEIPVVIMGYIEGDTKIGIGIIDSNNVLDLYLVMIVDFYSSEELSEMIGPEITSLIESQFGTDYPKQICISEIKFEFKYANNWADIDFSETEGAISAFNIPSSKESGIIYYMKDEYGNEAPYDFKNIKFEHDGWSYYTFSCPMYGGEKIDGTVLNPDEVLFKNNKIGECFKWAGSMSTWEIHEYNVRTLNKNIFEAGGVAVISNILGRNCENNYIIDSSYTKIEDFGLGNTISSSNGNNFKTCCYQNSVYEGFGNTFGMGCHDNFLTYAWNNDFQDGCYSNIIEGDNIYDNYSYGNIFGNNCRNNKLRHNCRYNTFAGGVEGNQLADSCYNCTFDTYANNNIVRRVGKYIHFGSQCHNIELKRPYTRYVTIEDNCANLNITSSESTSASKHIQNIRILSGLNGGENKPIQTVTIETLENQYPIVVGLNSSGVITQLNPLD